MVDIGKMKCINHQRKRNKSHKSRYTDNMLSEERILDEVSSGQMDCYDANSMTLYDYKTAGSYKVMQALEIVMVDVPTGEVYKIGRASCRERV